MRLSEDAAPELVETAATRELADTAILYEGMSLADLAHVVMLSEKELIPHPASGLLLYTLLQAHPRPPLDFGRDPATGDLFANREAYLGMFTTHAGYLTAGRPRREAITIAYRVATRQRLLELAAALGRCARAAAELAEEHLDTLFPDYTYLQTAQPTTFGHYLLAFVYPILRDLERLQGVYARVNASPAGSGSVNGSRLPLDRERLAALLGFDSLITHTRDAMWQADLPVEVAAVLAAALVNLDRLAEDLQIFATQEFGLVELADRHSRASKIMPQKKNPYALTYVRGAAGEALGTLVAMAATGKTPSGQPDNRLFAQGSVPRAVDQAAGVARLMAGVLRGLTVNTERATERAAAAFAGSADLAEIIMLEAGLNYRIAHQVVAHLVREALAQGQTTVTPEMVAAAAQAVIGRPVELPAERLAEALDPAAIVATRQTPGGAAEAPMRAMLAGVQAILDGYSQWVQERIRRLEAAEANLLATAQALAIPPEEPLAGPGEKTMGDLLREMPEMDWRRRSRFFR
ncbi:MAG: argininosuccinate lyase [Chloroflexi bacterium]|nr:argininosuccinate lyase [Chloroflexota bacterium]MCI0575281.1 argininosuccinate lyase [Chloroflexota bacterium]MCI0645727.1 argininosuccinate lyase [Chloroflexota bacterium]MCI0730132.1 argininosuccinate lyase [Chloroflexota bacterium]